MQDLFIDNISPGKPLFPKYVRAGRRIGQGEKPPVFPCRPIGS